MGTSLDKLKRLLPLALLCLVVACSGDGEEPAPPPGDDLGGSTPPPPPPTPPPTPLPDDPPPDKLTRAEGAALLTQATFGPSLADIDALEDTSASAWLLAEFDKPPSYHLPNVLAELPDGDLSDANGMHVSGAANRAVASFWNAAISGDDQLRQRTAYALSQIVVTSGGSGAALEIEPHTQAAYIDILVEHAFGNYRDLLEDITYSVAMARYLTYLSNLKGDPVSGRVPDENFARELMQLFTIGLLELNRDGTPKLNGGEPAETYTNDDITGLARVFTGLGQNGVSINSYLEEELEPDAHYTPLIVFPEWHSELEKSFLGTTIPANTSAEASIDQALDTLFNHPNVGPFVGRQLIQRFVTSDPKPEYVEEVATAFESGSYSLPDGTGVGDGQRGNLRATIAAVLFSTAARTAALREQPDFGKLREPVLRFTHWARAFEVNSANAAKSYNFFDVSGADKLNQHPFNAPSVFNFYRPGYVAPGTETGAAGITAPEFQIVNSISIVGYANFMSTYIFGYDSQANSLPNPTFQPDYSDEMALADQPAELLDHLDTLLTNNHLSTESMSRISNIIADLPLADATRDEDLKRRAELAVLLVMTSPEYLIQR